MSGAGVVLGYVGLGLWLFGLVGCGLAALWGAVRRPRKYRGRPLI